MNVLLIYPCMRPLTPKILLSKSGFVQKELVYVVNDPAPFRFGWYPAKCNISCGRQHPCAKPMLYTDPGSWCIMHHVYNALLIVMLSHVLTSPLFNSSPKTAPANSAKLIQATETSTAEIKFPNVAIHFFPPVSSLSQFAVFFFGCCLLLLLLSGFFPLSPQGTDRESNQLAMGENKSDGTICSVWTCVRNWRIIVA